MSNFFSKNLKYIREKKNISKNRLGEMVGVNQTTIGRWEAEEIKPSIDNVEEVANVLNVKLPDMLITDLSQNEPKPLDELEILFSKNKDILTKEDEEYIKFIIKKRKREIDKEKELD